MADAKLKVTIINQKEGKLVLGPDPEELKAYEAAPKGKKKPADRVVPSGQSIEVSAEEAEKLLNHRGVVDAAKAVPTQGAQVANLKKQLADLQAENDKLRKGQEDADGADADLGDGDDVMTPSGLQGVIVSIKGKMAKVKLENGNVSQFPLKDLKALAPA